MIGLPTGIIGFLLAKRQVDKNRLKQLKIRQRMKKSNEGEYEGSRYQHPTQDVKVDPWGPPVAPEIGTDAALQHGHSGNQSWKMIPDDDVNTVETWMCEFLRWLHKYSQYENMTFYNKYFIFGWSGWQVDD